MSGFNRWRAVVRPNVDREVDDEISFHLEMRVREMMESGLSEGDARARAREMFGDVGRIDAECRKEGRSRNREFVRMQLMQDFTSDVRFALRSLIKSPGFTAVAVLTIAIGIASTTSIFSAVNGVLLHPLSFTASDRLVVPQSQDRVDQSTWSISYADFQDWERAHVFEHVALYTTRGVNLSTGERTSWMQAARVTPDFFNVLGLKPALGRVLNDADYASSDPPPVVISNEFWQRELGGRRDVVGTTLRVAGNSSTILGVLPAGAAFPSGTDVWLPQRILPQDRPNYERRDNYVFLGIARLAPGRTIESSRAAMRALAATVEAQLPATRGKVSMTATPLDEWMVGQSFSRTLWIFLGAVVFVLLIACVNIANLILSRASTRAREIALRQALGAGRVRVLRQLLTESLVLAIGGGVIGVALSFATVRAIVAYAPPGTPRLEDVRVSGPVLLFALLATIISAVLFGLYPALRSSRNSEAGALSEGSTRTTGSRGMRRGRNLLVISELALSLVLLTGAGLLLRSFARLRAADTGMATEHVTTFNAALQGPRYSEPAARAAAYRRLLDELRSIPGMSGAAATSALPLGGGGMYLGRAFLREGQPEPPASSDYGAQWNVITPEFFDVTGVPVVRGRAFSERDDEKAPLVAIINKEFARLLYPNEDPVGKRVRSWRDENELRTIVGVVENIPYYTAGDSVRSIIYVPHAQDAYGSMSIAVRTRGASSGLEQQLRQAVSRVDPTVAVANVLTMDQVKDSSMAPQRFSMLLLTSFAAIALVLALIGIYGVLAYAVARRGREMAVRMALGAQRQEVSMLILREAGVVIASGIVVGTVLSLGLTRLMTSLLYGISAADIPTFAGSAAFIAIVALCASALPARRATLVEPMQAMRGE